MAQLSNELASVRRQYDTLVADSEMKEEELRAEIINLETQLDQVVVWGCVVRSFWGGVVR